MKKKLCVLIFRSEVQEGIQKAVQEAVQETSQKARQEGRHDMGLDIARDMIKDNEPIEKIIKYSKLSEEAILELQRQINL